MALLLNTKAEVDEGEFKIKPFNMKSRFFPPGSASAQRWGAACPVALRPFSEGRLLSYHLRENHSHLRERFFPVTWGKACLLSPEGKLLFCHLTEGSSFVTWETAPLLSPEGKLSRRLTQGSPPVTRGKASVLVSAAAGNKSATRPPLPPPACGAEWKKKKETGRNWWVGIRAV